MNAMTETSSFTAADQLPARPITILIAALGGEGGGVLADWVVDAATTAGYPVQSTSIPGVAQRTGATTYYIEMFPATVDKLGGRRPVLALTPSPGNIDIMVASEFVEAGRAMQNGYVSPERTTLVASTHRIYSTMEKMAMGDGRFDDERLHRGAQALAKRAVTCDMAELARQSGTIINAVLFGAMAGSGALPLSRDACEAAIRKHGKGAEASLRGFAAGYAHAIGEAKEAPRAANPMRPDPIERVRTAFPAATHAIIGEGMRRTADYQDERYATLYLDRLQQILHADDGRDDYALTNETARYLALWMCYEDVIRVADLKSRRSRFERVRNEVMARPDEPLKIVEFLKPGVEEVAAVLPPRLSSALTRWAERRGLMHKLNVGMYVRTTSVHGFLMLRLLAWLRPLRRKTARFHDEQALIERWLGAVRAAAARDRALALEIALCGRLIKGYGDTHRRGKGNFLRILDTLVDGGNFANDGERAMAIKRAREAALADPEGRTLEQSLATHGIAPLPPQAKPIRFIKPAAR